jgi:hypothetical protein
VGRFFRTIRREAQQIPASAGNLLIAGVNAFHRSVKAVNLHEHVKATDSKMDPRWNQDPKTGDVSVCEHVHVDVFVPPGRF